MSKIHSLSQGELWQLEQKVRKAILGTDPQTRRMFTNFLAIINNEQARRNDATQKVEA